MIQHMLIFCLVARCKAINVFYKCDTRVVYSIPTWGTDLLLGFFLCDNLDRWRPCEPADPLSNDFCSTPVKEDSDTRKTEVLGPHWTVIVNGKERVIHYMGLYHTRMCGVGLSRYVL